MAGGLMSAPGIQALMAAVEVLTARQRAMAQNVANVDTPGYQAVDVNFPAAMQRALAEQVAVGGPGVADPASMPLQAAPGVMRVDGNGVDLDKQMVEIAETSTWYAAAVQDLQLQLQLLKTAVSDGGAVQP
jgi:flagellar basal-body rod protein FlgB